MSEVEEIPSKKHISSAAPPDVGGKYEVAVATLVAANLAINPRVKNYHIFTNLTELEPFADVVAKVLFDDDNTYAYVIQVKHRNKGEKNLDVSKYLSGYGKLSNSKEFKEAISDVPVDNIHFCYVCIERPQKIKGYKSDDFNLTSDSWRSALSFPNCHKLSREDTSQINETEKGFLDSFYLYFDQPNIKNIKCQIQRICKITDVKEILNFVDDFVSEEELQSNGLSKEIFETELLRIRLSHKIMPLENNIPLNDLPVAIWKNLTLQPDVTIVKNEIDIQKVLYGRLEQMLNYLLNGVVDWTNCKCKRNILDSTIIDEFEKLFTTTRVRHWIDQPLTLESLIIELWKCGEVPLILKSDEELSALNEYGHLHKKYIIITDDLVSRRKELEKIPGLNVFTTIKDIQNPERDELLKNIWVSLQGRRPVTLYDIVNDDDKLAEKLTYSHILHLMKNRKAYLSEKCLDGERNIFLIEDPMSSAVYDIANIDKKGSNITIRRQSNEISKYREQIKEQPKLQSYTVYHCAISSENGNLTLIEGNKSLSGDFFIDQYGENVYNLEDNIVPILGCNVKTIRQNYISRFLRTAIVSKSLLFDSERNGICFFSGDFTYLDANIKRDIVKVPLSQIEAQIPSSDANIFIEIKNEDVEEYWKGASNLERPLLHICVGGTGLELCKSKNWEGIGDYISYSGRQISEENVLLEITDRITILTGEPGIGKSSLLRSIFKKHAVEKYILFYNLVDYKVKKENQILPTDYSLDFILNKLEEMRYRDFLFDLYKRKDRLVVLLDSFDEVLPSHKEKTLNFIRNLAASDVKIIIASRLIANYILLHNFETRIIKVDILGVEDSKEYMKNCKLDERVLPTTPPEFLKHPLYLNLLQTIAEHNIDLTSINKFGLFENIVRIKLHQYFEGRDYVIHVEQRILELHWKLALVRILGMDVVETLFKWKIEKDLFNEVKLGIIVSIDEEGYPKFAHETFAEYLTADWIIRNITTDSARVIYSEILEQGKLYVLDILCEHLELHKIVLALKNKQINDHVVDYSHLEKTDALGRTALHVAAAYYKHNLSRDIYSLGSITDFIHDVHKLKSNFTDTDNLMRWDWIGHLNSGNVIKLMPHDDFSTLVLEAYVNGIVHKLRKGVVELDSDDHLAEEIGETYTEAMEVSSINLIRDLVFLESDTSTGVSIADALNDKRGFTPLHVACINGNVEMVKELIIQHHDVNATDDFECTPLHYSVINPPEVCMDMTNILLDSGSTLNIMNHMNETAISVAVRSGNLGIVRLLLQRSGSGNSRRKSTQMPLFLALKKANRNMVELLLEYEADVNSTNENSESALQFLFTPDCEKYDSNLVKLLIDNGANINYEGEFGMSALLLAIKYGNLDGTRLLLEHGADVNSITYRGMPLINASKRSNSRIVELLLEKGANINGTIADGVTALMYAVQYHNSCNVKLLLERGAEVDSKTTKGKTALMCVSHRTDSKIVKLLLEKGADVNCKTTDGEKPLTIASRSGNSNVIKLLLEAGANVNSKTAENKTPLILASEEGHSDVVKLLLEKNANVNDRTAESKTSLILASEKGHSDVVKLLLRKDANVNDRTTGGQTSLILASENGYLDVVKLLLEKYADVDDTIAKRKTPLILASEKGHLEVVKLLIEKGAGVDSTAEGNTPLMFASKIRNNRNVVELLLERGADINSTTESGESPLIFAAKSGNSDIVELLLENGADINSATTNGETPLIIACQGRNSDIVRLILENGGNTNSITISGKTALMFAAESSNLDTVKLLLGNGADINSTTTNGETPLLIASQIGNSDVIRLLLAHGANINSATQYGETPLIVASQACDSNILKLLLKNGADVNSTTTDGETPLMVAVRLNNLDAIKLLLEKSANINSKNADGETLLMVAIRLNNLDAVKFLSEKSDNINSKNEDGETPLMVAIRLNNLDAVKLLLEKDDSINGKNTDGETPLIFAIRWNNLNAITLLLKNGANIDIQATNGETPLMLAIRWNRLKAIELLLEQGANINAMRNGKTSIILASEEGFLDVVKLLLKTGADVNVTTAERKSPLILASEKGHLDVVELLLKKSPNVDTTTAERMTLRGFASEKRGSLKRIVTSLDNSDAIELWEDDGNINRKNAYGETPSLSDIQCNRPNIMELLFERSPNDDDTTAERMRLRGFASEKRGSLKRIVISLDNSDAIELLLLFINSKNAYGETLNRNRLNAIEFLLEKVANVNAMRNGKTPLILASEKGYTEVVELLLEKGANINDTTAERKSPLILASEKGFTKVVKLLLNKGADVNDTTAECKTALILASEKGYSEVVKLLLEGGANVCDRTAEGQTSLILAAQNGHSDIVKLLLEKGANVGDTTTERKTPLILASEKGYLEVVKLLLEKGANICDRTVEGQTSLIMASENGYPDVIKLLIEKGANIENTLAENKEVITMSLYNAIRLNNIYAIKLLLEKNGNINTKNANGETLLTSAIRWNNLGAIKLLLEKGANMNIQDANGEPPLLSAIRWNRLNAIELLLEEGANINAAGGKTPLMFAIQQENLTAVKLLLKNDVNISRNEKYHLAHLLDKIV